MLNNLIKRFIVYVILFYLSFSCVSDAAIIQPTQEFPQPWQNPDAYRPNPVLFNHGFSGGSNYIWNPDPNAPNQAEEQKKATAVLSKKFGKYYQRMGKSMEPTQVPYLETIEFFNKFDDKKEQIRDRNSSIDDYKIGDYYVKKGWRDPGDPGWGDKVARVITGNGGPPYDRLYYLLFPDQTGYIQNKYKTPSGSDKDVKVKVVAHSMGGLAAREYITNLQYRDVVNNSDAKDSIDSLITTGTPHLGSPWAPVANAITTTADTVGILAFLRGPLALIWSKAFVEIGDMAIENFNWVDIDGDAVNDMDPTLLGSGFLEELNERPHPKGVRYYVIYGTHPAMEIIEWIAVQSLIHDLRVLGVPPEDIEEVLENVYGIDIGIAEIISSSVGDGVVPLNSQRGLEKGWRVFELVKEEGIIASHGTESIQVAVSSGDAESPLFRMLDNTKPVIEITEVKDTQNRVIWRVGQWPEYFNVPQDGIVKVHGLCRKEYLPADTYINIGFRKAGQTEAKWLTESGGTTQDQSQAQQWLLQPSDLWQASNPDSPVAEFDVEIDFPLDEVTHSIVVQATNPSDIKSDPVEVGEKTHYIYAVGRDNNGEGVLQCLDGPTSFVDGIGAVVSEFNLIDENGFKISARPLDITDDRSNAWAQNIWVSFDNKRIYCYDISTMKSKQLADGRYYYTTTATPDGLYYDGNLQYCFSGNNKVYRINLTNGVETDLGAVSRRLSLDGMATDSLNVNYTTQEYAGYNPTAISATYLCSNSKISKKLSGYPNFLQTIPIETPVWTDEQNIPASVVGVVEIEDNTVSEGIAVYLSCTDRNIYKANFESNSIEVRKSLTDRLFRKIDIDTGQDLYYESISTFWPLELLPEVGIAVSGHTKTFGRYIERVLPLSSPPIEEYLVTSGEFAAILPSPVSIYGSSLSFVSGYNPYDTAINKWNNSIPGTTIMTQPFDGIPWITFAARSPNMRVLNVKEVVPDTSFDVIYIYENESQTLPVSGDWQSRIMSRFRVKRWLSLINNGSLETLNRFRTSIPVAEGIATGPRVKIKIEPETLRLVVGQTGQLNVNGKAPYAWESSDETVCVIEGDGETVTVKVVDTGTSTILVRDALSNIAYAIVTVL